MLKQGVATLCLLVATPCFIVATIIINLNKLCGHRIIYMEIYHITWATHNSRISDRMIEYKKGREEPLLLDDESELFITMVIARIIYKKRLRVHAYNICRDHIHIIIECKEYEIPGIIRLIKGKTSQRYKEYCGIAPDVKYHLWTQKYGKGKIFSDEHYHYSVRYVTSNRFKHHLPQSEGLQRIIRMMTIV